VTVQTFTGRQVFKHLKLGAIDAASGSVPMMMKTWIAKGRPILLSRLVGTQRNLATELQINLQAWQKLPKEKYKDAIQTAVYSQTLNNVVNF
jgi:hypothetical protein